MKKQSGQKKPLSLEAFKKGLSRHKKHLDASFSLSATWVREALHENKMMLQSARGNTSECVTIKPPKEVFNAILAEMLGKKSLPEKDNLKGGCL